MGSNNWLYGCLRCYIDGSSSNTQMIGSYNCSAIHVSGLTMVNCTNFAADNRHIGWTVVNNGRVLPNLFTNATGSAPTYVTGNYNLYKVDSSLAVATIQFDIVALRGCAVTLKVIDGTNGISITSKAALGTEKFEFNLLPYSLSCSTGDSFTVWSDGTDLFII